MRYLLNYATQIGIKPRQSDFVTAYLNSETLDTARGVIEKPEDFVIKLRKILYGLKQAARGWYNTMTAWFIKHGYRISDADPCLFISNKGSLAFAWVDNLILIGNDTDEILRSLSKSFKIKDRIRTSGYLSQCTRSDIAYTVGKLLQFQPNKIMTLIGFVNCGYSEDNKSQTTNGYCFQMAGGGGYFW